MKTLLLAGLASILTVTPVAAAPTAEAIKDCETVQAVSMEANSILWEARIEGWTEIAIKAQQLIQDSDEFIEEYCWSQGIY